MLTYKKIEFFRYKRIRQVMSELWDPDDCVKYSGTATVRLFYQRHCDDPQVRKSFLELMECKGEVEFQMWGRNWWSWVENYIEQLPCLGLEKKSQIVNQLIEILEGSREELES